MPWLYYQEDANTVLTDETITTSYKFPNFKLGLYASVFSLNGSFLGYRKVTGGLLQLCKNSDTYMDAAYVFGTSYQQTVSSLYFFLFALSIVMYFYHSLFGVFTCTRKCCDMLCSFVTLVVTSQVLVRFS